jgi:hypothetical protein
MLSFNHYLLISLTLHMRSTLVSSCTLFPTTCSAMIFCELTLAIYKPPVGEEKVAQDEVYYEEYERV